MCHMGGPDRRARWLTHTHTLVTTRLNPACHVAHCCAPQDQCVPRPHETTRAHPCQACCMLHIACLVVAHFPLPCTNSHLLGPVLAPCYISPGWSYMWLRWAGGEHCVLTRLWFHSTHVADVTLLPAEALCCLSQSTRLMVSVRWHTTAFSIVYKISRSRNVMIFCEAVYEVHVGLDLMREFGFT